MAIRNCLARKDVRGACNDRKLLPRHDVGLEAEVFSDQDLRT